MNMKTSKCLLITAVAALSVGGLNIQKLHAADRARPIRPGSQPSPGESTTPAGPGQGHGLQVFEKMKEKLNLTDDQVAQIRLELQAEAEPLKDLMTRYQEARTGLRDAYQAPNANEASVRAAANKLGAVQTDLAVERFKLFNRINPILTEEQQEKMKQLQSQLDEFMSSALNRMGQRPGATPAQ